MTTYGYLTRCLLLIALAVPRLALSAPLVSTRADRARPPATGVDAKPVHVSRLVERDDVRREIRVTLLDDQSAADAAVPQATPGGPGKIVVRNRSFEYVDVYVSLDDPYTPWEYLSTLPPGYKVITWRPRRLPYVVAGDLSDGYDDGFEWGPASFFLRAKFVYTLLP